MTLYDILYIMSLIVDIFVIYESQFSCYYLLPYAPASSPASQFIRLSKPSKAYYSIRKRQRLYEGFQYSGLGRLWACMPVHVPIHGKRVLSASAFAFFWREGRHIPLFWIEELLPQRRPIISYSSSIISWRKSNDLEHRFIQLLLLLLDKRQEDDACLQRSSDMH